MVWDGTRGSSPRMRGAPHPQNPVDPHTRIIPADAGSTSRSKALALGCKDHPRGCGEHLIQAMRPDTAWGSSPRMRGAQTSIGPARAKSRIILADAGSTLWGGIDVRKSEDHPRGCGEHQAPLLAVGP